MPANDDSGGHGHAHGHTHGHEDPPARTRVRLSPCASASVSVADRSAAVSVLQAAPPSLAHQLWFPWRLLVLNPMASLALYILVNTSFVVIWWLLRLLASLLTVPGLLLTLVTLAVYGLRRVTSLMVYPGQLKLVIRDGEANFARLTKRRLGIVLEAAMLLSSLLATPLDQSATNRMRFLQAHQNFTFSIETLAMPLLKSLQVLEKDETIGVNGQIMLHVLRDLVAFQSSALMKICADLGFASKSDMEASRQEMARATEQHEDDGVAPGPQLAAIVTRLRDAIQLIGRPAEPKKGVSWIIKEFCGRKPKDADIITTLDLMRADMSVRFNAEQVWISGHQGHQVDAMFIPARTSNPSSQSDYPAVILCNPNGGLYEFHHLQMDWIKFYTDMGCHLLVFNYRGYGRNVGTPSPWAHNLDALALVEHLKVTRGIKRIAVHGESIGGLVATYLAKNSKDIDVLIADRTFATLPALAQRLVAKWTGSAVKSLTWWETDNAKNYLEAKCAKLLCSDPDDEIIHDAASLKTGVALRIALGDCGAEITSATATKSTTFANTINEIFSMSVEPPTRVRRVSEANSRPEIGGPLTEAMVRRFSECALSVGRRAMAYTARRDAEISASGGNIEGTHVTISMEEDQNEEDEHASMLPPKESLNFPEELLAVVWMQLACMDGFCGQCLLQAAESGGYDRIRAWTASLLVWGGNLPAEKRQKLSVQPFERQEIQINPISIFQAHRVLQEVLEEHPNVKFDFDIGFLVSMVEYFVDTLQHKWKIADDRAKKTGQPGGKEPIVDGEENLASYLEDDPESALGYLLPLQCGHNKNFLENEKQELSAFLRRVGFLRQQGSIK